MRKELGDLNDTQVIDQLLAVDGLTLIDVGCGAGRASQALVERGAAVLGVEPDPVQAAKNRAAPEVSGLRFAEAEATSLPAADGSMDGVFFFRSLHHVPITDMDAALAEAARVGKPNGGFFYVVEPAMTGSHFPVMRPFNDETIVRTAAQAALAQAADNLGMDLSTYGYVRYPRYADFEAMVEQVTGHTFIDIARENVETDEVRALFEAGQRDGDDYVFSQPMLLNLFRFGG